MVRIGLLSDSHGKAISTRLAVGLLLEHGAELLIHLGDAGSLEVIDALAGLSDHQGRPVPSHLVFGNVDWDVAGLTRYAQSLGIIVDHPVGRLDLADSRPADEKSSAVSPGKPESNQLIFTHGDDASILENALAQEVRYLCHGHTHQASDRRMGQTRVINPGALFRAQTCSVALLDTQNDKLAFYPIGRG